MNMPQFFEGKPDIVGKNSICRRTWIKFLTGLWLGCDITAPNRKEIIDVLKLV